ncbi:acyl-CoA N-acyltransferase [Gilbertella persicaria]|uniref:acyl-CoA N-acyltransferase n=1 Tax=Gilbertella persicaria TaxID=101096 RepID=UPI0022208C42|nr:acyl-CoA N-acyltransferase [Gilbertella persicaria]KAI8092437.1 acyl-CoA N-acyltransferase [Gilbertella persicaria]
MVISLKEYAMARSQIVNWEEFIAQHTWASSYQKPTHNRVPSHCVAIYHQVDLDKKTVKDTLYVTTWDDQFKSEFKDLSLAWVKEHFVVEEEDIRQLETPEEAIIKPGGEIFFLLESTGRVAGVVAIVLHEGICELAKMTVRKEYTGKGYAHILMRESIEWARSKKYPFVELMSNTVLENAIVLYKKYGFETTHLGPHSAYARANIIMRLTF